MNSLKQPNIAIVIPVHNRRDTTLTCLNRISKALCPLVDLNIIVVDDGSTDGTSESIKSMYPDVTLIIGNGSLWWSGATNLGIKYALKCGAEYILALNDDVDFEDSFLEHMLTTAQTYSNCIVCGIVCYDRNRGKVYSAGRFRAGFLGYKTPAKHAEKLVSDIKEDLIESELESGYAMLIPAELFKRIGLFDAEKFPHHMGDMDFVLRAKEIGYRVLVNTKARLYSAPGKNYLFNALVEKTFIENLHSLFDIKSTVYWRTRINFITRHTHPAILAPISILYFLVRMASLLLAKGIFPDSFLKQIAYRRYGKDVYENQ